MLHKIVRILVLLASALLVPAFAQAPFPSKPLRIVVPYGPGGGADITARTVGQKLSQVLGQPVVIDNKPSAGGVVAGELVAHAEPDGYTLLLVSSGTAVSAALFKSLPFDTLKDFTGVSRMADFDLVLAVSENSRFKSLADLLAYGRANPGKLNIGTPQVGTTQNLAAELFKTRSGLDFQIVPFNGTTPVVTTLRGGGIDAMIDILGPVLAQLQSHQMRALAVLGGQRSSALPEVPAVHEAGGTLAQFNVSSWNGLAVPAKTPRDVVLRLNHALQTVMADPEVKKRLADLSLNAKGSTPEQAQELLASEVQRWTEVIAHAKIQKH